MVKDGKRGITISFSPTNVISTVIVVGWVLAYFLDTFMGSFERPASLDPLMLMVGAFWLAKESVVRGQQQQNNQQPPPPTEPVIDGGDHADLGE